MLKCTTVCYVNCDSENCDAFWRFESREYRGSLDCLKLAAVDDAIDFGWQENHNTDTPRHFCPRCQEEIEALNLLQNAKINRNKTV